MLEEINSPIDQRFLMVYGRLNNAMINELEHKIIPEWLERMKGRLDSEISNAYKRFTERDRSNDAAYFTSYAYADIKLGRRYNWLYRKTNPIDAIKSDCIVEHIIYEGWFPSDRIEHGHKHILFLRFNDNIPDVVNTFKGWDDIGVKSWEYGLCDHGTYTKKSKASNRLQATAKRRA